MAMRDALQIRLDASVFAVDVVQRALYAYTLDYYVDVGVSGGAIVVDLRPKTETLVPERLADEFRNAVLDEALRARVRSESGTVHVELIRAALQGALATGTPE
jgi:His-Xaa-Ser system protein HxsD